MTVEAIKRIRPNTGRPKLPKKRHRRTKSELARAANRPEPVLKSTDETKKLLSLSTGKKRKGLELFAMSDYITIGRIEKVLKSIRTSPYGLILHEYIIKTFGNVEMAAIISYLLYMEEHLVKKDTPYSQRWFVVIYDQLKKYTGLKHNRVCNTIQELREVGLIDTEMRGMPARQHFRIDNEFLMSLIFEANPPRGWKGKNVDEMLGIYEPNSDIPLFKNQRHGSKNK